MSGEPPLPAGGSDRSVSILYFCQAPFADFKRVGSDYSFAHEGHTSLLSCSVKDANKTAFLPIPLKQKNAARTIASRIYSRNIPFDGTAGPAAASET